MRYKDWIIPAGVCQPFRYSKNHANLLSSLRLECPDIMSCGTQKSSPTQANSDQNDGSNLMPERSLIRTIFPSAEVLVHALASISLMLNCTLCLLLLYEDSQPLDYTILVLRMSSLYLSTLVACGSLKKDIMGCRSRDECYMGCLMTETNPKTVISPDESDIQLCLLISVNR